jgi:hypothetical protein
MVKEGPGVGCAPRSIEMNDCNDRRRADVEDVPIEGKWEEKRSKRRSRMNESSDGS